MGTRCRLCAESADDAVSVFTESELTAKIELLFQVTITLDDRLPLHICRLCCETVLNTWEYSEKVHRAQDFLAQLTLINSDKVGSEEKDMVECDVTDDNNSSEQVACQELQSTTEKRVKKIKMKSRRIKKKDSEVDSDSLSGYSDFEVSADGSFLISPSLQGWESYPWVCCDCQVQAANGDDLRDHHATIHGQGPKYTCADCPKVYSKYSTFLAHVKSHRSKLRFCCDICGKWFPNVRMQEKHRSGHGDERPHGCATCGKRFRMQSALLVHARSHLPAELKNRHQCDLCPKRFGTKPNLMAHKRIHTGVRDYTCDQCGKSFVQKGNLDNHLLTHTAARPFPCSTCGKSFKTLVRLRKHGSVHSGLKPHQCDVCGRQFRERGTLKEHHRIHTGAMPFTCEFCGKSFRFKGVLTTHRRQHTGERPYSCLECQHHFTNWPNYNKHMKRRHGINTSVTVRKPQSIPPTGMPQRNPPGSVLAPPQPVLITEGFNDGATPFYPVLNIYNLTDELLQQQRV